jgi:hypothetical protein
MGLEKKHVDDACAIGTGSKTCSYLLLGANGFECAKENPGMKTLIDERRRSGTMSAKGDNCSGPPDFKKTVQG